jgi:tol-pal system protein YbgF
MSKVLKLFFVAALFAGTALSVPAFAQSGSEANSRLNQMEEQMRTLVGQVEELNFAVKQLQSQLAAGRNIGAGDAAPSDVAQQPLVKARKPMPVQQAEADTKGVDGGGIEQIEDVSQAPLTESSADAEAAVPARKAPGAKLLGALGNSKPAAEPGDGGFQGQVLVAPGEEAQQDAGNGSVETVALASETPESLYERSNESLLRRQFGQAEEGFRHFIEKYPDHNLAGSAQYWLGETYYAQGQYRDAAKNFLSGYQQFPKSRRAPDSLLKLGMSLNKLGQREQACASLGAVGQQFPNAVDAKKRAQAEFRRAGC